MLFLVPADRARSEAYDREKLGFRPASICADSRHKKKNPAACLIALYIRSTGSQPRVTTGPLGQLHPRGGRFGFQRSTPPFGLLRRSDGGVQEWFARNVGPIVGDVKRFSTASSKVPSYIHDVCDTRLPLPRFFYSWLLFCICRASSPKIKIWAPR